MGRSCAPKCGRSIAPELPDDLMNIIFSKLDFESKVNAGKVCKEWDQLLKASSTGAKHWGVVCYDVDSGLSSQTSTRANRVSPLQQFETGIGRWIINRAGAIEILKVSATLPDDQQGVANMKLLESALPLLAGCLSKHDNAIELTFTDGSPFASPLLSSSDFLTFLCPMVTSLTMCNMEASIPASQFAAMCQLSMLESLEISGASEDGESELGLQEMTSSIGKLVNLTSLELRDNFSLGYIPEAISCLQKLNRMIILGSAIRELRGGLARLGNLAMLEFGQCWYLRFPHSLQGLKQLTSVALIDCCLEAIPEALGDVPSLVSLDLAMNQFGSQDGWPWWPTTLVRLTKLESLDLLCCSILSLPPHISGLRGLKELRVGANRLNSLPDELSCLRSLETLQADENCFATVPVSVLSMLTTMSAINLARQFSRGGPSFKVSTPLLPILHPGLVELDLTHQQWDALSLCHLGRAMAEVANRTPAVKILWRVAL